VITVDIFLKVVFPVKATGEISTTNDLTTIPINLIFYPIILSYWTKKTFFVHYSEHNEQKDFFWIFLDKKNHPLII
jgi:hypothetical protein